jgi:hypothetical protein
MQLFSRRIENFSFERIVSDSRVEISLNQVMIVPEKILVEGTLEIQGTLLVQNG